MWEFILWVIALFLVVGGAVRAFRGDILWGVVLIILGLLIGPAGISIFS